MTRSLRCAARWLQTDNHRGGTMRKTIWTGTCSVIVGIAAAVVTAQTSSAPQTSSPPQTTSPPANTITVTGCLKEAPATSAQSSPTTSAPGAAGTTGTTGAAG